MDQITEKSITILNTMDNSMVSILNELPTILNSGLEHGSDLFFRFIYLSISIKVGYIFLSLLFIISFIYYSKRFLKWCIENLDDSQGFSICIGVFFIILFIIIFINTIFYQIPDLFKIIFVPEIWMMETIDVIDKIKM